LYITQQALSKTIKNLEEELGFILFHRTSKGVEITEVGLYLNAKSIAILDGVEGLKNDIIEIFQEDYGDISMCIAPGILRSISPEIFIELKKRHSKINLTTSEYTDYICEDMIIDEQSDIGFCLKPLHNKYLNFTSVKKEKMFLIVNKEHPLGKEKILSIDQLRDHEFVMLDERYLLREMFDKKCMEYGFAPNIIFESEDVEVLSKMVRLNKGLFVCVDHVCEDLSHYKELNFIPFKDENFDWDIGLVTKKDRPISPSVQTIIDFVKDEKNSSFLLLK
jgi:DNA-binding transcriptional LysR family regulator